MGPLFNGSNLCSSKPVASISTNKENSSSEKKASSFPTFAPLNSCSPLRSKRPISPSLDTFSVAAKKPSPVKKGKDCINDDGNSIVVSNNRLTLGNLYALGKSDEFKSGEFRKKPSTSNESMSTSDESIGASVSSLLYGETSSSSCDSLLSLSSGTESFNGSFPDCSSRLTPVDLIDKTGSKSQEFSSLSNVDNDDLSFKPVRETLCKSPLISPKGDSVNDVYRVDGSINHRPYYFKNLGPVNVEQKLNLTLNKLFKQLLNDSSVKLGNYEVLSHDELKFVPDKHDVQNIMLVQEEIDSRFKPLGSVENINQLYSFYNNGKDDQGRDLKGYFQRALLYTILTGQYDEHSGNLNQDKTTKELCRYDLDLSFSGGRILKDYVDFIKYDDVFTRFGLRSVLLFAITEDSHKLLLDECLSGDLKSDLSTLISINLDGYFPHAISEKTIKLKQFINSNFLKIKGLLDSEESVTLLDVLKMCYPEVAITLETSRNLLNAELKEKPQDNKEVLKTWFNAVNQCFGGIDFFEDMQYLRADLDDGNLNFLGKITAHLFNEDGTVKTFLPESIADINKS